MGLVLGVVHPGLILGHGLRFISKYFSQLKPDLTLVSTECVKPLNTTSDSTRRDKLTTMSADDRSGGGGWSDNYLGESDRIAYLPLRQFRLQSSIAGCVCVCVGGVGG